ncbi:MAG TPA: hypothetical protein VIC60_11000, partial [Thermomicrobiales bacterium]
RAGKNHAILPALDSKGTVRTSEARGIPTFSNRVALLTGTVMALPALQRYWLDHEATSRSG